MATKYGWQNNIMKNTAITNEQNLHLGDVDDSHSFVSDLN